MVGLSIPSTLRLMHHSTCSPPRSIACVESHNSNPTLCCHTLASPNSTSSPISPRSSVRTDEFGVPPRGLSWGHPRMFAPCIAPLLSSLTQDTPLVLYVEGYWGEAEAEVIASPICTFSSMRPARTRHASAPINDGPLSNARRPLHKRAAVVSVPFIRSMGCLPPVQ